MLLSWQKIWKNLVIRPNLTDFWRQGFQKRSWKAFKSNPVGWVGLGLVGFFVICAVLAPFLSSYDPIGTDWAAIRQPPSRIHLLGTDELGRDIYCRLLFGARVSIVAGLFAVATAFLIGVPLGTVAGYVGGGWDAVISRCADALLAIPALILAIAVAAALGPSLINAMIAIGLANVPIFVRLSRGQVLGIKHKEYIEAAIAVGASHGRILLRYILPNILAPLLIQATLSLAGAILSEASLSFLGLGQQPPLASWGSQLNTAKNFLVQAPWLAIFPGLAILLTVLGVNLLGDALRDAFDPKKLR